LTVIDIYLLEQRQVTSATYVRPIHAESGVINIRHALPLSIDLNLSKGS